MEQYFERPVPVAPDQRPALSTVEIKGAWEWDSRPHSLCFRRKDKRLKSGDPLVIAYKTVPLGWHDRTPPEAVTDNWTWRTLQTNDRAVYVGLIHHEQATVHLPHSTRVIVRVDGPFILDETAVTRRTQARAALSYSARQVRSLSLLTTPPLPAGSGPAYAEQDGTVVVHCKSGLRVGRVVDCTQGWLFSPSAVTASLRSSQTR